MMRRLIRKVINYIDDKIDQARKFLKRNNDLLRLLEVVAIGLLVWRLW